MIMKLDGKKYDCFVQSVDLNMNGRWVLRYAIGIMGREGHGNASITTMNSTASTK